MRLILAEGVIGLTCSLISLGILSNLLLLLSGGCSGKLLLEVWLAGGGRVTTREGKLLQHLAVLLLLLGCGSCSVLS